MRKITVTLGIVLGLGFGACNNQPKEEITTDVVNNPETAAETTDELAKEDLPVMTFEEEVFEFGDITQGEKVYHSYQFKNTGKTDLVITSASATCGCTVPKWPKKPLAPGEGGIIEVVFNSEGKKGLQHKKVTVIANTHPSTNVVALKGNVIAPNTEEKK